MLENEQIESSRYPGVFVTRKKKTAKFAEASTTLCIPFSFADDMSDFDWMEESDEKPHRSESPSSELGSEQCLSSDTSCQARFRQLVKDAEIEDSENDDKNQKRPKRKKSKDKKILESNTALDAIRYKTKMCKNWQLYEKCPYGPRCLFAHGAKELRTYAINHSAITSAVNSESPERQFYALGHFPSFIPVPFLGSSCSSMGSSEDNVSEDHGEAPALPAAKAVDSFEKPPRVNTTTPSPKPPSEHSLGTSLMAPICSALQVTTHSPYTAPPSPPPLTAAATAAASATTACPPSPVFSSLPTSFPYCSGFVAPASTTTSLTNLCRCPPCARMQDLVAPPAMGGMTPVVVPPSCVTPPPMLALPLAAPPSPTTPPSYGSMFGAPTVVAAPPQATMLGGCYPMFTSPAPCLAMPYSMQLTAMPTTQAAFPWQMVAPAWGMTFGMEPRMYW